MEDLSFMRTMTEFVLWKYNELGSLLIFTKTEALKICNVESEGSEIEGMWLGLRWPKITLRLHLFTADTERPPLRRSLPAVNI